MKFAVVIGALVYMCSSSLLGVTCQPNIINEIAGSPFAILGGFTPSGLAFSPDGQFLATANQGNNVTLFSVATGGALTQIGVPF